MFGWWKKRKEAQAEADPKNPSYWTARGHTHPNILAVAYGWGQIDETGKPLPEPHVSRE